MQLHAHSTRMIKQYIVPSAIAVASLAAATILGPSVSFALVMHNYTCSDFTPTLAGGATCASDVVSLPVANSTYAIDGTGSDDAHFPLNASATYYVSATMSGSGQLCMYGDGAHGGTVYPLGETSSFTDAAIVMPTNGGVNNLSFLVGFGPSGCADTFVGTVSNICITDTIGGCSGGGGGGGATSTVPWVSPFSLTGSSTAYSVVDNPVQDLFDGVLLFMIAMVTIIWLLRKN